MSYDFTLMDPDTGRACRFDGVHGMVGGTYAIGGTDEATLNVTYNYGKHYYRVLGDDGLRGIHGMTGARSVPWLLAGINKLSDAPGHDYWDGTEGNAKAALKNLFEMARTFPNGIWECDELPSVVGPLYAKRSMERWLARKASAVRERVRRLNPGGLAEGSRPRGWCPKSRWNRFIEDVITPRQFIMQQGVEAYRAVPERFWMHRGCKKAMRRMDYLDNLWKFPERLEYKGHGDRKQVIYNPPRA